ncbi:hypothetical protein [Amycolatopsis sp. PS_44_ISF1]|uniref:hypothetical protein n=1 Tax=Amycolatopsis sp. PS_44_ISF1 TaxID=2974917 RepID=UPI0028DFA96E|nr:hypothetical protein [Amycolatopsis sp. PS_44_ISF1]MDT8914448.1 hypothetical protein [Amycolatopsis sp. PS_44_ISF1]
MEASRHNRSSSPAVAGGRSVVAPGGTLSAVGRLIERADALHLRAPELALVLGERAAALAEAAGADEQWIRAESLVVSARVRVGSRPSTVGRAVAALRAAEHAGYGDIAARLRIDLAVCARSLGTPLTGIAALRPVLSDPAVSPVHRAEALCHLVGCLAQFGRKTELDRVLIEADRLVQDDDSLDADTRLLVRALLRNGTAAHRRRHGDLTAAADAARTGLGLLEKMDRPEDDGGLVRVRLVLQLVSTLLDRGDAEMALEIAQPTLAQPVRAAGVGPASWLRLAVATRIHLPAGAGEAATELVREAVASTERHGLHSVTARLWLELSQIEERFGRAEEAIACLHRSRAAEHLHSRSRRQACGLLAGEFGAGTLAAVDLDDVLAVAPPRPVPIAVEPLREDDSTTFMRPAELTRHDRARPADETAYFTAEGSVPEPEPASATPSWSFGRTGAETEQTAIFPAIRDRADAPVSPRQAEPVARKPEQVAENPVVAKESAPRPEVAPSGGKRRQEDADRRAASPQQAEGSGRRAAESGAGRSERVGRRAAESPGQPGSVERRDAVAKSGGGRRRQEDVDARRAAEAQPAALPGWVKPFRRPETAAAPEPAEAAREKTETRRQKPAPEPVAAPPVAETPRVESRGAENPSPETPGPGTPSLGTSAAEAPVVESPVGESPVAQSPVSEAPVARPEPARLSLAMPDLSDILPELALAPSPAEETAAPLWESDEWAREERARREVQGGRKTRHDSEHGSVAARSVLDRLGISGGGGSGGGRRRADESGSEPVSAESWPHESGSPASGPPVSGANESGLTESGLTEPGTPESGPRAAGTPGEPARTPEPAAESDPPWKRESASPRRPELTEEETAAEPWLPRLRMPPSLDPLEDFDSWTPTSQPFPESYARAIAEEEPPPDAGLAELLARALAEHQAGTASAAALVKKLGSKDEQPGHRRSVNGHSAGRDGRRNGSVD